MEYVEYNVKVFKSGNRFWYNKNGKRHREDGPAIEYADGSGSWYKEGKCHREDGPAVEYPDGTKFWYREGKCHREDGPAIEYADGDNCWYLDDVYYTEEEYNKELMRRKNSCSDKVIEIEGKKYNLVEV